MVSYYGRSQSRRFSEKGVNVLGAALDAATVVSAADWQSVISAMTAQISVSTVVGVLATLITAGVGLVFMWWGVRKALSSLMAAFRKGKLSIGG